MKCVSTLQQSQIVYCGELTGICQFCQQGSLVFVILDRSDAHNKSDEALMRLIVSRSIPSLLYHNVNAVRLSQQRIKITMLGDRILVSVNAAVCLQ